MGTNVVRSYDTSAARVDMKFEAVVIPVLDVDRAKKFYKRLGWRLDADFRFDNGFRVVQFTPPGSGCSVQFGTSITSAVPGSAQGCTWSFPTSRLRAASSSLALLRSAKSFTRVRRARSSSPTAHQAGSAGQCPITRPTTPLPRSTIPMAMAGCCRRSRHGFPAESTQARQRLHQWRTWPTHLGMRRPLTVITRNAPARPTRNGPTGTPHTWLRSKPEPSCRSERR